MKTRAEVRGGGRKPWPQKGLGRARHGSIRSPLWRKGGKAHGPRSPTTYFYMLPFYTRVAGLTGALSVKLAQDDLHIVNDLEIPSTEPSYLQDLIEQRNWGPSVLFVDSKDEMPPNMTAASDQIRHVNLMPVYGLFLSNSSLFFAMSPRCLEQCYIDSVTFFRSKRVQYVETRYASADRTRRSFDRRQNIVPSEPDGRQKSYH